MNLNEIDRKCFIMALFIRDDAKRLLLGSGAYEFKESQLHFAANSMTNDVVEVQGNDGYMLAGQVRRPTTQVFDGYIGDASVNKSEIEGFRREFFSFFQKNHFFTVVYLMADGTAIQRRRGFIVDAPEVKELWQMFPEYHIGMNFEDVNYYRYSENASGEETYGKSANVGLSTDVVGGLVWDYEEGTAEFSGSDMSIMNTRAGALEIGRIKGDTYQQTETGKNLLPPIADGTYARNGVSLTVSNGIMSFSGTCTGTVDWYIALSKDVVLSASTYTRSENRSQMARLNTNLATGSAGWSFNVGYNGDAKTQTLSASTTIHFYVLTIVNGVNYSGLTIQPQLEAGSTATSFEPYVGGTASPNPDFPQEVQTVTGRQTITIDDGGEQSQTYEINLGDIELCKIGDYQDYIYKDGDSWYLHKETNKYTFTGSENWTTAVAATGYMRANVSVGERHGSNEAYCDEFINRGSQAHGSYEYIWAQPNETSFYIQILETRANSLAGFKTWLASNPATIYYTLATPTDTEITDTALIEQLEALTAATSYNDFTKITVEGNLVAILSGAVLNYSGGAVFDENGAVWEEGGGGTTTVMVDSVSNIFPTWIVKGPTKNPILTNTTTGTSIKYNGNITKSQTLVVDMMNQTAKLNGTSVIGNISGDWLEFAPGNNTVSYTADNANAPNSTIEWQEVVG